MKPLSVAGNCLTAFLGVSGVNADAAKPEEIAQAQAIINGQLLDPGSAQFKITSIQHLGSASAPAFCGFINAKNSFGGYTGFQPFVIFAGKITIYDGRPGTGAAFADLQKLLCGS